MRTANTKAGKLFRLTAVSAALLAAFGTARAEDDEVKRLTTPESSVSIGLGSWSTARPQMGIYDGQRNSGLSALLDMDIVQRYDNSGTWLMFKANNLGLTTPDLRADYIKQGKFGTFFEYSKIERDNPFTFNTGLQGIGTTTLTTGTNLGSAQKTNVELGTTRELLHWGGYKNLSPGIDAKLDFKTEDKKGTRQWGWGSAALFSVEPIDSTTRQLKASLEFAGERLQLAGGYLGSWYNNHNQQVFEQLNGVTGGTSAQFNANTPMSLPLSNQAHQLFLDGGYSFAPATRGTFKLSFTRAMQDEHIPSYDLTGANAPYAYAPSHLSGLVDTSLAQLGLSSQVTPKLKLTGSMRYFDVNDRTPLAGYVGNNATGVTSVYNTPQSYTINSDMLEANYRLPDGYSLTGGIDYKHTNRSFPIVGTTYVPMRADVTDQTYRVQLRHSLGESVNGSVAYLRSERTGTAYQQINPSVSYNTQINPMYLADRLRDQWRTNVEWEASEKLSLQFRVDLSQDKYPDNGRPYGLKDGNSQVYSVDSTYTFSDNWQLSLWYSHDQSDANEVGFRAAGTGAADAVKDAKLKDATDSIGLSLKGKLTARLETTLGVDWYSSTSSYPQDLTLSGAGSAYPTGSSGPLPDVHDDVLRIKFDAKYALDKKSDLGFSFIYERWHTDDWSWTFANGSPYTYYSGALTCTGCTGPGYTGVVDGTSVSAKSVQTSYFIGMRYIYKF